jgi:serine/threonine protein phosphatase PrpC
MNSLSARNFDAWADSLDGHDGDIRRIYDALVPVMEALAHFHSVAKGHGNIRPESLIVTEGKVDLALFNTSATPTMYRIGNYAPPEANVDPPPPPTPAGDVYSLAAVLYHGLCGSPPPPARRRLEQLDLSVPMCALNPNLCDALNQGLMLKADHRPADVGAFRRLLERPRTHPTEGSVQNPQWKRWTSPPLSDHRLLTSASQLKLSESESEREASGSLATPVPTALMSPRPSKPVSTAPPQPKLPPAPKSVERLAVNLTVGKQCAIKVASLFKDVVGSWKVNFVNAKEMGFAHDAASDTLIGTPVLAGEHELRLELTISNAPGRPPLQRIIALTINPDPDSLWKNLPSNTSDPYFKPDTDHADVSTASGRMLAASQRGRSHAHEGLFRDDDFRLSFHQATGWHLLVAADGAGSAKYSRRGAQIACRRAIAFMERWIEGQHDSLTTAVESHIATGDDQAMRKGAYSWLGGAAFDARKAIQSEAETHEPAAAPRDYATTLLLAAAKEFQAGWAIVTFSVGDGGIGLLRNDGQVKVLCTPDSGEFSGQTVFLTASDVMGNADKIMQRVHVAHEPNLSVLVLMTDGVTDPKFPTEASLSDAGVWKSFWSELTGAVNFGPENTETADELLKWLSFRSPGNHDDRTIALLLPKSGRGK